MLVDSLHNLLRLEQCVSMDGAQCVAMAIDGHGLQSTACCGGHLCPSVDRIPDVFVAAYQKCSFHIYCSVTDKIYLSIAHAILWSVTASSTVRWIYLLVYCRKKRLLVLIRVFFVHCGYCLA